MLTNPQNRFAALFLLVLSSLPIAVMAKNAACAGITKKCTKDTTYDKTIDGTIYSCYDCTQTLCTNGGTGGIAGTATSSVCTSKATTFQSISTDDQLRGGDTLAPKSATPKRPRSVEDPRRKLDTAPDHVSPQKTRPVKFDEADALFGNRTRLQSASAEPRTASSPVNRDHRPASSVKATICLPIDLFPLPTKNKDLRDHRAGSTETTRDHRVRPRGANTIVKVTSNARSAKRLQVPSDLAIQTASRTTLTISWRDNSTDGYGVELYRSDPVAGRRDPENAWKFIGTFQARIADRVTGTGMRMDEDAGLSPGTTYCYRMRAYIGFDRSQVSNFSEVACAETRSSASAQTGAPRSRGT